MQESRPRPDAFITAGHYFPEAYRWELRVRSATNPRHNYIVSYTLGQGWACECEGFRRWHTDCRHIREAAPIFRKVRDEIIAYCDAVLEWQFRETRRQRQLAATREALDRELMRRCFPARWA